jgi:hypothetical protein
MMKSMRLAVPGGMGCCILSSWLCYAQSTQGIVSGRIYDIRTGKGIENGDVNCTKLATNEQRRARSDAEGTFVLSLVSPGTYYCRAQAPGSAQGSDYQARETYGLELPVAGRLDLDFPLRPAGDVYDQGLYADGFFGDTGVIVHVFAADVRTTRAAPLNVPEAQVGALEATISEVLSLSQIQDLPLAGRDVYALLITQPGVTSDAGTARSLGLSANGQRPSASNFLLDGLEDNNSLITGPLTTPNPEAVQEYRVSTTMYAAEYGRTGGYLANAITRVGTNTWHGLGYFNIENDILNANDFQRNTEGLPRTPLKQLNPGFFLGGPVIKDKLFISAALDYTRFRSFTDPVTVRLPTSMFHPQQGSTAAKLFQLYPPPSIKSSGTSAEVSLAPPVSLDRYLAMARADYAPGSGKNRLTFRTTVDRENRGDFLWTPYPQFIMPLSLNSLSTAIAWTYSSPGGLSQEFRAGWNANEIRFDRPHPEVPTLHSSDHTILPGSPALYGFLNRARDFEFVENIAWVKGRHLPKFGGGILFHHVKGYLTLAREGIYEYPNLSAFGMGQWSVYFVAIPRVDASVTSTSNLPVPDYNRTWEQKQVYLFAQDSYKLTPRFVVNYGVRYENFGVPRNIAVTQDATLVLGAGSTFIDRLNNANIINYPPGTGLQLYDPDNRDWGARAGFSWSINRDAITVLRGGFGIFYDRPFDNEWENIRNNSVVLAALAPEESEPIVDTTQFPRITFYQPGIRSPYVENYFLGLQQQLTHAMTLSVNGLGSLGRQLITTDVLNRGRLPSTPGPLDFYRPELPKIYYRANQGASSDYGLNVAVRLRVPRGQFHLAWTWSHSIDNQSEPLAGDYYNLDYFGIIPAQPSVSAAAFTRQFDSSADRGNSDFDQRYSVVFFSIWDLPSPSRASKANFFLRNWKVSQLAAVRSGLPFSVLASGDALLYDNRANILDPQNMLSNQATTGGRVLLNSSAFGPPGPQQIGNSGRNAFRAPRFYDVDVSLSRAFVLPWLGEAGRLLVRADSFNILNHANLGTPDNALGSPTFGVATYGRQGVTSGFPAAIPFQETARQIQLFLKIEF